MRTIRALDLFCGAGGSSWGARLAGVNILAAFDAWEAAETAYRRNFPATKFFPGKLERVDPKSVKRKLGEVDMILASPECQSHSVARGAADKSDPSRRTAYQVTRFAAVFKPRWVVVENVVSMRNWKGYARFLRRLRSLGYHVSEQRLNAAHFGVPQGRRRLFLLCDRVTPPLTVAPKKTKPVSAARILESNGAYPFTPLRTKNRSNDTLARARRAIRSLGPRSRFILVYYGSDGAGGWQRVSRPLRTVTTVDRFALVKPTGKGHVMRMLQVPELKRAMGIPEAFQLGDGTRRQKIHLLGNAVCPPLMRAVVSTLIKQRTAKAVRA